jgi:hypothetical protein
MGLELSEPPEVIVKSIEVTVMQKNRQEERYKLQATGPLYTMLAFELDMTAYPDRHHRQNSRSTSNSHLL